MTQPRLISCLIAALALLVVATVIPARAEAAAQESCGKQVILDWWDNERVDRRIYPVHCYRDAIKMLSEDLRVYSGAEQDILRALAYALQGRRDPGGEGPGATPVVQQPTQPAPEEAPAPPEEAVHTSGPSAIPIPLVVLSSIAGLLVVLGAAGHLKRRLAKSRGGDPPPTA